MGKLPNNTMFIKKRFVFDIRQDKAYRRYIFLNDSKEIINKIFRHTENFLKFSTFSEEEIFNIGSKKLLALCHKVNMVKYHLLKYGQIEKKYLSLFEKYINTEQVTKGRFTIEKCELTAEYEGFLFQVKAALDVLTSFLNPLYRKDNNNPLKKQITFENKGKNVIKNLENYVKKHKTKEKYLAELINYLKKECANKKDGSLSWISTIIERRNEAAHYGKDCWFSFQINNKAGENKSVFPPRLTINQTMNSALKVTYDNLLVFIQDFIALLLGPYINPYFDFATFPREEIVSYAPRWYIHLKPLKRYNLKCFQVRPEVIKEYCEDRKIPIDSESTMNLYKYYNTFYKAPNNSLQ